MECWNVGILEEDSASLIPNPPFHSSNIPIEVMDESKIMIKTGQRAYLSAIRDRYLARPCYGSSRGARIRATVRAGGNGGVAAASGSAAGDDRYGAGLEIPAPPGDFSSYQVFSGKSDWTYNA